MEIKPIASSSKGNAYLISDGQTAILIECGLPIKELKTKTDFFKNVDACLVSHSHNDHAKSLKDVLANGITCYALKETFEAKGIKNHHRAVSVKLNEIYKIGTMSLIPLEMQHDVPCCGFYIYSKATYEYLLFATDTYLIKTNPTFANYIMIEANYDVNLVEDDGLRERLIKSHMSIETTVKYLKSINLERVKKIYLMHLSARHSDEADFKRRVQAATGKEVVVCDEFAY